MIKTKVATISYDPITHSPILILQSLDEKMLLPFWIGPYEAYAIMMILEGIESPRPLTHRTLFNIIESTSLKIEKVIIDKVQEMEGGQAYLCDMILRDGKKKITIDCRPSDGIAIALMANVPIMVSKELMGEGELGESRVMTKDKIKKALEGLTPDDFDIPGDKKVH